MNENINENSLENAKLFLERSEERTVPNERVGKKYYLDIADSGLDKISEILNQEND